LKCSAAGSRLATLILRPIDAPCSWRAWQYVLCNALQIEMTTVQ
jgi:hypothetical protein